MPKLAVNTDYEQKRTDVLSPEVCVDYLSYTFDEMDLAASWRVMTKQKKDIVNGIRLENASWRTWNKQRNHLKTVSPETLNWLKDSDVTWLYGPLHTVIKTGDETNRFAQPKVASASDTLGLMLNSGSGTRRASSSGSKGKETDLPTHNDPASLIEEPPSRLSRPLKSALKKVTMSDLLRRSASELQMDALNDDAVSITEANRALGVFSPSVIATHRQPKLRFNQHVEQCVALADSRKGRRSRARLVANDSSSYSEESEEDADGLSMSATPRSIKKIAPARLKSSRDSDSDALSTHYHPPLVRYDSNSSWGDDEEDVQSIHLPHVFEESVGSTEEHPVGSAIQWEGQACVYSSMLPPEIDYEDDWDPPREEEVTTLSTRGTSAFPPPIQPSSHPATLKSPAVCKPSSVDIVTPQLARASKAPSEPLHRPVQQYQQSIFGNFAQWASSCLFRPSSSSSSSTTTPRQRQSM